LRGLRQTFRAGPHRELDHGATLATKIREHARFVLVATLLEHATLDVVLGRARQLALRDA
jgi:hypothetical protein